MPITHFCREDRPVIIRWRYAVWVSREDDHHMIMGTRNELDAQCSYEYYRDSGKYDKVELLRQPANDWEPIESWKRYKPLKNNESPQQPANPDASKGEECASTCVNSSC